MIHLVDLEKSFTSSRGRHVVLHRTNLSIPSTMRIGVLGMNGAGKSTLLHMIAGSEPPTAGRVLRECRCSWPLGFAGSFQPNLTGIENILFAARVYGVDCDEAVAFAAEFAEIGEYIDMPVRTYSSGMKARLAFGLSLAIDFDIYLIDEITAVGDRRFQEKCRRAFAERTSKSGLCIVSHNEANIRTFCDIALVLHNGFLTPFEDIESALEYYASIMRFD
jgi:capsular polysaccharide transport system ATP-binding protein